VILIDATYLNSGGGLVLLQELMLQLRGCGDFALLRDIRVTDLDTCGWTVYDMPPRESAYVSDGHPHKNHLKLIAAWGQLAQQGLYPELHLTVGAAHVELLKVISLAQQQGLKVINHGYTQPSKLYAACGYQIYPSILESFGLGLIEAAQAGCAVLASDLPYVTEVIRPWKVFNPDDAASIASTVATCYQKPAPASEVLTPNRIDAIRDWLVSSIQTSTRTHS
jgi:glycosyltransferase involved in cell wall biosynthesis